jgi:UDP-N-acetylmuramate--alanine ligase
MKESQSTSVSAIWKAARDRGLPERGFLLSVDVDAQRLLLIRGGRLQATYPVSTSRLGLGNREGSYQTPPGWHRVVEWIGDGEPAGRVFSERKPTARTVGSADGTADDLILTRIMRLEGLEPGVNRGPGIDSFERFIYLHGTNREDQLGRPASRGCVRMSSPGIVEVFDATRGCSAWCWIGRSG